MEFTLNQFHSAVTLFLSLLVEAMPFLLLGVLFSSLLQWFVDEQKLLAKVPEHPLLGALTGSAMGLLFPVCECGNVPVARRFLLQRLPISLAMGFLLAAPTINPIVIWATWVAFRDQPEIVILRVVFSLIIATLMGWIFSSQKDLHQILQPAITRLLPKEKESQDESISPLLQSGTFLLGAGETPLRLESIPLWQAEGFLPENPVNTTRAPSQTLSPDISTPTGVFQRQLQGVRSWFFPATPERVRLFTTSMIQELRDLGGILILGSAIAAIIQVAVPREIILNLGQGPVTSIIAMLVLGAVVSICSTVDSFFALSFASIFTSGSLLAFLVFGPMIDIKSIGLMLSIFKTRAVVYLMVLIAQLTFVMTLAVNLYLS